MDLCLKASLEEGWKTPEDGNSGPSQSTCSQVTLQQGGKSPLE